MMRKLVIIASTASVGSIGLALGVTIHGPTARAWLPTLAGVAGGFGLGYAGQHVANLWRAGQRRADA